MINRSLKRILKRMLMARVGLRSVRIALLDLLSKSKMLLRWTSKFWRRGELRRWLRTWLLNLDSKYLVCMERSFRNLLVIQQISFIGQCKRPTTNNQDARAWINTSKMSNSGPITITWNSLKHRQIEDQLIHLKPNTIRKSPNIILLTKLIWKITGSSMMSSAIRNSGKNGNHKKDGLKLKSNSDVKVLIEISELFKKSMRLRKLKKLKTSKERSSWRR